MRWSGWPHEVRSTKDKGRKEGDCGCELFTSVASFGFCTSYVALFTSLPCCNLPVLCSIATDPLTRVPRQRSKCCSSIRRATTIDTNLGGFLRGCPTKVNR